MKKLILIVLILAFGAMYTLATFKALSSYQAWAEPAQTESVEAAFGLPIRIYVGWNS